MRKKNSGEDFPKLPRGTKVPNHLVIIPDGNRRWARERKLPTLEGHKRGFDITPKIAKAARHFGVHTVTIWAFSTENWDRAKGELDYLMKLYEWFLDSHLEEAQKDGVKIIHLGRKDRLPKTLQFKLRETEKLTKKNSKNILNIALDYGGRDEIIRAVKGILKAGIKPNELTEEKFKEHLDTANQPHPYPDLAIRTSGEMRISGFLPWQMAYTELYFEKSHFPDYTPQKLKKAIMAYSKRDRRFGGNTKEEVKISQEVSQIVKMAASLSS